MKVIVAVMVSRELICCGRGIFFTNDSVNSLKPEMFFGRSDRSRSSPNPKQIVLRDSSLSYP